MLIKSGRREAEQTDLWLQANMTSTSHELGMQKLLLEKL